MDTQETRLPEVAGNFPPAQQNPAPAVSATNGEGAAVPAAVAPDDAPPIDSAKEIVEYKLEVPIDFDGKHYDSLVFDFKGIKKSQWRAIRLTYKGLHPEENNPMPVDDEDYHAIVAAEAAKVPLLLFEDDVMSPADWSQVWVITLQFLSKRLVPRLTRPKPSRG